MQAVKIGFVEAVDIIVINKADLPGSAILALDLAQVLSEHPRRIKVGRPVAAQRASGAEGAHESNDEVWTGLTRHDLQWRRAEADIASRVQLGFAKGPVAQVRAAAASLRLAESVCRDDEMARAAAASLSEEVLRAAEQQFNPRCHYAGS